MTKYILMRVTHKCEIKHHFLCTSLHGFTCIYCVISLNAWHNLTWFYCVLDQFWFLLFPQTHHLPHYHRLMRNQSLVNKILSMLHTLFPVYAASRFLERHKPHVTTTGTFFSIWPFSHFLTQISVPAFTACFLSTEPVTVLYDAGVHRSPHPPRTCGRQLPAPAPATLATKTTVLFTYGRATLRPYQELLRAHTLCVTCIKYIYF